MLLPLVLLLPLLLTDGATGYVTRYAAYDYAAFVRATSVRH